MAAKRGRDDRQGRGDRQRHGGGSRDAGRQRDGHGQRRPEQRSIAAVPTGDLPRWVRDEISRTTPKDRREPAMTRLAKAVSEFADERYGAAFEQLKQAKDLAPQVATVRELLGLSAYHLERWDVALKELRTFRRISGEPTQVPVELDCLRALGRTEDLAKTYQSLRDLDPRPETEDEARVVYASSLLERGLLEDAWTVIKPGRLVSNPRPSALRRWYVAGRIAAASGNRDAAMRFVKAISDADGDFPGLAELRAEIPSD